MHSKWKDEHHSAFLPLTQVKISALAVTAVISSTFMLSRKKNRETYRQEGGKIKEGRGEKGKVSNGELSDDKIQPTREKGNTAE